MTTVLMTAVLTATATLSPGERFTGVGWIRRRLPG
jgi:hypothetical protein